MVTQEHLEEQKNKYKERMEYFKNIGFDVLAKEFQDVVDLINEMERCIKEMGNEKV